MNCLVVITHPLDNSLCRNLGEHIALQLKQSGNNVTIENLYESDFNPVLSAAERTTYYSQNYDVSLMRDSCQRLEQADVLVLVYPTWWFGFPAMLKGWFDRVWGPGIAYDHAKNLSAILPRLEKLRTVLVVTSLGAPWWVDQLIMRQPLKRVVKYGILKPCAPDARLHYLSLYNSENVVTARYDRFVGKINRIVSTLG